MEGAQSLGPQKVKKGDQNWVWKTKKRICKKNGGVKIDDLWDFLPNLIIWRKKNVLVHTKLLVF